MVNDKASGFFSTFRSAIDKAEDHVNGMQNQIAQLNAENTKLHNELKRTQQALLDEQTIRNELEKVVAKVANAVNNSHTEQDSGHPR